MTRVSKQDAKIMNIVSDAKADATATEARLDRLEKREKRVAAQIESERDQVSAVRVGLVDRRDRIANARATKFALLRRSRDRRHELQDDVEELREAQAKVQARLAGFSGPVSAGPVKPGSGGLIWPVNGPITSPFCEARSWESCHPGIDIGVPAGTPIRAAAAGKVVLCSRPASPAATGTSPASSTAARCRRVTRTSRGSARRWARPCRRVRSSATLDAPAAASGITSTSRPGSTARWSTR